MFLTDDELRDLTGYQTPAGFARWLDSRGWRYERARGGRVIVSRHYAETMMGGGSQRVAQPNFAAIGG